MVRGDVSRRISRGRRPGRRRIGRNENGTRAGARCNAGADARLRRNRCASSVSIYGVRRSRPVRQRAQSRRYRNDNALARDPQRARAPVLHRAHETRRAPVGLASRMGRTVCVDGGLGILGARHRSGLLTISDGRSTAGAVHRGFAFSRQTSARSAGSPVRR